ncbi:MAG: TSUP family transporter [Deltaproteobacteria bacterium]|nr:TSUP family transporter [Deltaproteobacteria bacterium]
MTLPILAALFGAGFVAGFIDAIAGGGGLIAVPVLLWSGLPPHVALGTNKLQSSIGTAVAVARYVRAGLVRWRDVRLGTITSFVAAMAGTWCVSRLDPAALRTVIPVLLLVIAAWMLLQPQLGAEARPPLVDPRVFALVAGSVLGFYDGFFGPGTGSFWTVACVGVLGLELRGATAYTKVVNLASNVGALVLFALAGRVDYRVGLVMIAGQVTGARLGSGLVIRRGASLIRPIFVAMVVALALKLLLAHP